MSTKTLGGFVCVRDGFHLDYSWVEAAESLLKIVDQLVLCDSDSSDGTTQAMQRMADADPRIKYVNWPWPNPKNEGHHWFIKWLRFAQSHLTTDYCIYLDGDEVLSDAPECHAAIREAMENNRCLAVDRLNFWRDAYSLVPEGECCGKWCVRFGPTDYPVVSDEPHGRGECKIVDEAVHEPRVQLFHLGFLRRRDALYAKAKVVLGAWFGAPDQRLIRGEQEGKELWETECSYTDRLVPFSGYMPDSVQRWLSERGHAVPNYLPRLPEKVEPQIQLATPSPSEPINVRVCGDLGDIIAACATFKAIGAVNILAVDRGICKSLLPRLHLIQPLLEAQPYIKSVKVHEDEPVNWDASDFRTRHRWSQSLHFSHQAHYNAQTHLPKITPDFRKPWLTNIVPDPRAAGRVVVHRTERYNNELFPWRKIFSFYGHRILIVGTPDERGMLTAYAGEAEYVPTADLLEVAQLVAGASLVIAGQSCVLAIAEGLKRPRIAEISPSQPDVIVALGPDVQYVADGNVRLPDVAGSGETYISSMEIEWENINTNVTPKGGWKHPDMAGAPYHFNVASHTLAGIKQIPIAEAKVMLLRYTAERCPNFYTNPGRRQAMATYELAIQNALK